MKIRASLFLFFTVLTTSHGGFCADLFNGTSDFIKIPFNTKFDSPGGQLSYVTWVKGNSPASPANIIGHSVGCGYNMSVSTNTSIECVLNTGVSHVLLSSVFTWDTNWHFMSCVYDGANLHLYVDGSEDPSSPLAVTGNVSACGAGENLVLGANINSISNFKGSLDDIALYKYGLSANDVKSLYQSRSINIRTPMIGHWVLNEGSPNEKMSGATFFDISGNGLNGTANSGASTTLQMTPSPLEYP